MSAAEPTNQGRVIWITGLSGAGKTTLARTLLPHLPGAILLDGDELREVLGSSSSGFDAESRKQLALTYARFARLLARQDKTVLVATISLFHEVHAWNRANLPGYVEVFIDVPEKIRRSRDPKGLYAAEQKGGLRQMAGSGTSVEMPTAPHIRIDAVVPVEEAVKAVLSYINKSC